MSAQLAYVGCRTTEQRQGHGRGISVYRVEHGHWDPLQRLEGLVNPSYLALGRSGRHLYTVHGDHGEVSAFAIEDPGTLRPLNTVSCAGRNPVHLTPLDRRTLAVANYSSGSVALLEINPDGSLGEATTPLALTGTPGPHPTEQTAAQPHQVLADGDLLIVPDKGTDTIHLLERRGDALAVVAAAAAHPGAGPRHACRHPYLPLLYVVNELDSSIASYRFDVKRRTLTAPRVLQTLPDNAGAEIAGHEAPSAATGQGNTAAGIALTPDARFLYVSNRGHDSIACYRVDPADGQLTSLGATPTGGACPRFITLYPGGRRVYAANEGGDSITSLRIDPSTGLLEREATTVETGSPVSIVFRALPRR